jgi:hypothetical protein
MTKFVGKGRSKWKQCHLTHDQNICAIIAPKDFTMKTNVHKVFTMNFLETKAKIILDIGYDHLAPNMATILSIHALHLQRPMHNWKHMW